MSGIDSSCKVLSSVNDKLVYKAICCLKEGDYIAVREKGLKKIESIYFRDYRVNNKKGLEIYRIKKRDNMIDDILLEKGCSILENNEFVNIKEAKFAIQDRQKRHYRTYTIQLEDNIDSENRDTIFINGIEVIVKNITLPKFLKKDSLEKEENISMSKKTDIYRVP
jgi:hypothetical protein